MSEQPSRQPGFGMVHPRSKKEAREILRQYTQSQIDADPILRQLQEEFDLKEHSR